MALNAFKYIFASAREAGGGAAAPTFPDHVRSLGRGVTESRPERPCLCHFSGACSFTCKTKALSFKNVFYELPFMGVQKRIEPAEVKCSFLPSRGCQRSVVSLGLSGFLSQCLVHCGMHRLMVLTVAIARIENIRNF